ncbi:hypothetical protein JQ620_15735 [Bradyrhizobium sp. AUGA SZCCT0274]|uniref:hypothetical protein n=1 Tax=Bradyrhizobium sp. AUGA SZCCT0274 TaxID=2807670 RepID=UPI001BA5A1D5|nr:hypothetical protein [Bradyrhizobium sp. AUGA SZCCT0274]MBR1241580.1 hypothetical protein [Bradyrhizobium sp. AUGA SZCCT0274]
MVAVKKRKRAAGAGRKPIGAQAKKANFSTRIAPETRAKLDALAFASGGRRSVSQVAEQMLQLGLRLAVEGEREAGDPIRAIAYLMRMLAQACEYVDAGEKREWQTDPFVFDAFSRSVNMLMERLRPPGEIRAPEKFVSPGVPAWPDSKMQAEVAFAGIWHIVLSTKQNFSPSEQRKRDEGAAKIGAEMGWDLTITEEMTGRAMNHRYAIENIRRDLGIKSEGEKS